ncbi:MAG: VPLPA-CTERM sorting domain-containing protein [Pseudomonadota bacterium]
MKRLLTAVATVAAFTFASAAGAVTLGTFTHVYGSNSGNVDPGGNDALNPNSVTVSDQSSSRFSDTFDFSGLAYDSISSFTLTLDYAGAGSGFCLISFCFGEVWAARVQGSDPSGSDDDLFARIDGTQTQTITADAASAGDAFETAVAGEALTFWFSELTSGSDAFTLNSATLTIDGVPAVPLPAGLPLLLLGLGGLAALRRRQTA